MRKSGTKRAILQKKTLIDSSYRQQTHDAARRLSVGSSEPAFDKQFTNADTKKRVAALLSSWTYTFPERGGENCFFELSFYKVSPSHISLNVSLSDEGEPC